MGPGIQTDTILSSTSSQPDKEIDRDNLRQKVLRRGNHGGLGNTQNVYVMSPTSKMPALSLDLKKD